MAGLQATRWGRPRARPAALVVLCHGVGADGHDLIDLAPHWARDAAGRGVRRPRCAGAV